MDHLSTILSGAMAQEQRMQNLAHDLANVNTPGHKQQRLLVHSAYPEIQVEVIQRSDPSSLLIPPPSDEIYGDRILAQVTDSEIDFSQGSLRTTGITTDIGIDGPGFFAVESDGEEFYTRAGAFELDSEGRLVTRVSNGWAPVLGENGPIQLSSANFDVLRDGTVQQDGQEIARLRVVNFADPQALTRVGFTIYRNAGNVAALQDINPEQTTIRQGTLEMSNAEPISSLVQMIEIQRAHQAMAKAMTTIDEMLGQRIDAAMR